MINILAVINKPVTGVEYHRMEMPLNYLHNHNPEFRVTQINTLDTTDPSVTDAMLKEFQIVIFSRLISSNGNTQIICNRLRSLGIKIVFDIDDYWILSKYHPMWAQYAEFRITEQTLEGIKAADLVTTTQPFFAGIIRRYNKNVEVLENAIDPEQPQFIPAPTESDRLRFGYMGGACHAEDVRLLKESMSGLNSDKNISRRFKTILFGYNKSPEQRYSVYDYYERVLTTDLESLSPDNYKRYNATDTYNYGYGYNQIDVALAPLSMTLFNQCKSELKIIEAGFMGKAIIVSRINPYSLIALHGINCLSVSPADNKSGWYKCMLRLIQSPDLVEELAAGLYETVKDKYHMKTVNEKRTQIYKSIV